MKTAAIATFRQRLTDDQPVYGMWVTLESASITEMAVAAGLDWVVIDAEHGHLDWGDIVDHVRAAVRSDTVVLVRIAELGRGLIKRVMDIGADGVIVPWIETVEQLEQAVAYATYPPKGQRGIGGERATGWGGCLVEHVGEADEHVLVVPMIESIEAGKNIEKLCEVSGVDVFFLGPNDYSSTAGFAGQWEGPGVAEELVAIKDTVRRHGKQCGVVTIGHDDLVKRREQGFGMLGLGSDAGLLLRSLTQSLTPIGRSFRIQTSFTPNNRE